MSRSLAQLRTNLGCALLLSPVLLGAYVLVVPHLLTRSQTELLCRQEARRELGGLVTGFADEGGGHARLRVLVRGAALDGALPGFRRVGCAVQGEGDQARAVLGQ